MLREMRIVPVEKMPCDGRYGQEKEKAIKKLFRVAWTLSANRYGSWEDQRFPYAMSAVNTVYAASRRFPTDISHGWDDWRDLSFYGRLAICPIALWRLAASLGVIESHEDVIVIEPSFYTRLTGTPLMREIEHLLVRSFDAEIGMFEPEEGGKTNATSPDGETRYYYARERELPQLFHDRWYATQVCVKMGRMTPDTSTLLKLMEKVSPSLNTRSRMLDVGKLHEEGLSDALAVVDSTWTSCGMNNISVGSLAMRHPRPSDEVREACDKIDCLIAAVEGRDELLNAIEGPFPFESWDESVARLGQSVEKIGLEGLYFAEKARREEQAQKEREWRERFPGGDGDGAEQGQESRKGMEAVS